MQGATHSLGAAGRLIVLGLTALLVLAGCAPAPVTREGPISLGEADRHARELRRAGDYRAAAQEYLRLGRSSAPEAHYIYELHAVEAYIDGRQIDAAQRLLPRIEVPEKAIYYQSWRSLLAGRLALLSNQPAQALAALKTAKAEALPPALRRELYRSRALAYSATGNFLEVARQRVALDPLIEDEKERRDNKQATWEAVNNAAGPDPLAAPPPDVLSGWMRLAAIAKHPVADRAQFQRAIDEWRLQFPNHPAGRDILPQLVEASTVEDLRPHRIALLLPFTGQFAGFATAIRDGVITAWYNDAGNPERASIAVYDANTGNITAVYQQAIREGAELIIGPLEKPAISALVNANLLSVPTLALNRLEAESTPGVRAEPVSSSSPRTLFQFGLLPEDEARQIAERAWFDGHVRALALVAANPWGERVFAAFKQRWETLGGQVVDQQGYASNSRDFATPVRSLLGESAAGVEPRAAEPGGAAAAEPPRREADFIFLAAYPLQARQINAQFMNHSQLPVYATSHVYAGSVQRDADHNLNGIVFCDMPWLLDPAGPAASLFATVQRNWPQNTLAYSRMYALGIDAYRIIPQLERLRVQRFARFEGGTGSLRIEPEGRVLRQLVWARFADGAPSLLGY